MRYFQYFLPYYSEIPLLFSTSGSNIGIQNLPLGKKKGMAEKGELKAISSAYF